MDKQKLTLIWHEAGNPLYHDRFLALSKCFDIDVLGPKVFQGIDFSKKNKKWPVRLYKSVFNFHWLTYFSFGMLWDALSSRSDVLYVHEEPHSITAFLCALFKGNKRLFVETSLINFKGSFFGLNFFERFVYFKAERLLPKNDEVKQVLIARGASVRKIAAPVGNGVSLDSFFEIEKNVARTVLSEKYPAASGLKSTVPLAVGFVGRIWRPKGLDILIKLKAAMPDLTVIVAGPVADDSLVQDLQKAGIGVLPKLEIDDLRLFYSALDIFILPSIDTPGWREQFGRVCAEAIFCGTPAIGSNVGGIPMVIGSENTFPPGDHEALLEKVHFLRDKVNRIQIVHAQKKYIDDRFTWDAISQQIMAISISEQ